MQDYVFILKVHPVGFKSPTATIYIQVNIDTLDVYLKPISLTPSWKYKFNHVAKRKLTPAIKSLIRSYKLPANSKRDIVQFSNWASRLNIIDGLPKGSKFENVKIN